MAKKSALGRVLDKLRKAHGPPDPPPSSDPFELVLWENVAYLVNDEKRARAFQALKKTVGLRPRDILAAPFEALLSVTSAGIKPELRVGVLRHAAEIAVKELGGDVGAALTRPQKEVMKALKKFPSIGEPGAEKILLFTRTQPIFAVESNGLRVLLRLGYGKEQKSYSTSYRSVREAVASEIVPDFDWLIGAHQLLRRHGQEICKRSTPICESCPLTEGCRYWLETRTRSS